MTCREQFSPLCDLHHASMLRMMLEGDTGQILSFHVCDRRDCSRVFRDGHGYGDVIAGVFDETRVSLKRCPLCASVLFLAEVDHSLKIETWECTQAGCEHTERIPSPSAR